MHRGGSFASVGGERGSSTVPEQGLGRSERRSFCATETRRQTEDETDKGQQRERETRQKKKNERLRESHPHETQDTTYQDTTSQHRKGTEQAWQHSTAQHSLHARSLCSNLGSIMLRTQPTDIWPGCPRGCPRQRKIAVEKPNDNTVLRSHVKMPPIVDHTRSR